MISQSLMMKGSSLSSKFVVLALLAWAISLVSEAGNNVGLYVALPLCFLAIFFRYNVLRHDAYVRLLLFFYLWGAVTAFFAVREPVAWLQVRRFIPTFMLCYVFAVIGKKWPLQGYIIYIVLWLCLLMYAYNNVLPTLDYTSDDRLQDERTNANMYAYYTVFATYALFMLDYFVQTSQKRLRSVIRGAFFLMIPLSFIIALFTASRQILIIQTPLISALLILRYVNNKGGM